MKARLHTNLSLRPTLNWFVWLALALLSPVAVYAQDAGTITGQILAEDGKAMADIRVNLSAFSGDRMRAISRMATTDENGRFQFRNLPNRGYSVLAFGQKGYVPKPRMTEQPTPARYYPGDNITITMIRGGVITGLVTNASGNPLINILVIAIRVRDQAGNKVGFQSGGQPRFTDDRGIYRIYGLLPGTYIVVANMGASPIAVTPSPYFGETPTYHPSSTRDTAAEVKITSGDEASGIDIRYRGDAGHA
ncbi:MAG: carboxypeptidase-like regulatory domain-containing protein, partial [Acidobacteriota bacterium]|nr:carboxypeptidase-like regulatory domain-containing protein [Acidobacteriota bacterium]